MKNLVKSVLLLMGVLVLGGAFSTEADAAVRVSKVKVASNYGSMVHVAVGKKVKLTTTVTVTPNKKKNKKVTYSSSNKKVAKVTSAGYVKGVKKGTCKITVKSKKNPAKRAKIKVKVVKKVTSVSLNQTSAEIYKGDKLTLTATVLPASGSYKKVTFTSSDTSVAKVTKKGVVTGKQAGTATITVKSVEGSNKKATCKIKVLSKDAINLTSARALAGDCIRVELNKAKVINTGDFVVKSKKYSAGNYNRSYSVRRIRSYNNKTYDIFLSTCNDLTEGEFVQVSVPSLSGNGTKAAECQVAFVKPETPENLYWTGFLGQEMEERVDLSDYCCGDVSYKVTGGVLGISYSQTENVLTFSGKYELSGKDGKITVTATDELGNSVSQTIYVAVGSASAIHGLGRSRSLVLDQEIEGLKVLEASGGSGEYLCTAENLPGGITMNENGTISGSPSVAGEYSATVTVKDKADPSISTSLTVNLKVETAKKFVGIVKDANQKAIAGQIITATNRYDGRVYQATTNANGYYSMSVPEGSYDITATYEGVDDCIYEITITSGSRQFDFAFTETTTSNEE
ncbi:MAG: Ig-like domain-containing protein [Eubacterium sp.]|nr:Ig-like domain-containing protein [Eubacterium sp.]